MRRYHQFAGLLALLTVTACGGDPAPPPPVAVLPAPVAPAALVEPAVDAGSGEIPKSVSELCPGAKLLVESEVMSWDKKPDRTNGSSARGSVQSNGNMRYLQIDVKKGVEQKSFSRDYNPFQNAPLSCGVYEFDVYLSPNYDGAATAPQIAGRKGPGGFIGGFDRINGSTKFIGDADPSDIRAPELNRGFSATNLWRGTKPDPRFYAYSVNRYALGANYDKNSKKLFGKTYTPNQIPRGRVQRGKWSTISFVVKLNDDQKYNGRGEIWIDGVKTLDTGSKFLWLYEPSKSGGITGYRVRHMYGGVSSRLIPTQDQYERYRNLRIWGVRQ